MFPDFHYLFQFLFGVDWPGLGVVKTFGFFVAMGFLVGAWFLGKELKRKSEEGLFQAQLATETIGKPATAAEIGGMALLGFLLGFKIGGIVTDAAVVGQDPIGYLLSLKGNIVLGIIIAALTASSRYYSKKKQALAEPVTRQVKVYPHHRIADIVFIAAIGGFVGAKLFNALETWDDFIKDPIGNLLAPSGLTYYGGLILATVALYLYCKSKKMSFRHLCDAAAPALILAYGIGRLGCQFSGDGDWGIYNSAYVSTPQGNLVQAPNRALYDSTVAKYPQVFIDRDLNHITPDKFVPAPSMLPDWLFAQNFKHNVNNDGVPILGDRGNYNHTLPAGVFPTSMYEAVICFFLFLFLWNMRKRFTGPLQLFGLYLICNGLERFTIESIRVNTTYDWGFIHPTQAQIIAVSLMLVGFTLFLYNKTKNKQSLSH